MTTTILDAIGNTPLVPLRRLNPNPRVRLLAKLEYLNPGGSIKDRPALAMIAAGEASGELTPDKTVIEATSGNTGIGLAMVCAVKGYKLLLVMSEAVSEERRQILRARGADILLTPGHLGTDGAIEETYRLVREHPAKYFMPDQYSNPANWQAHRDGTAVEILRQTDGRLDRVVATIGTTGTVMGLSHGLKAADPAICIVGVEPYLGHRIQGLKNLREAYCPEIFDAARLDRTVNIDDEEAFETARRLAREEGLMVGMSSGAAVAAARREVLTMSSGTVVVILPDGGERYLSTPLFTSRDTVAVTLYDAAQRAKVPFASEAAGKVNVFCCSPSLHDRMGLTACRRLVFTDLLCRYLEYRGFTVRQVLGLNDLDAKCITGSLAVGQPLEAYTATLIERFRADLAYLGVAPATVEARTGDHLGDMVTLADRLVQKGLAYEKLRSLYFDIGRFNAYGRLSRMNVSGVRPGVSVDVEPFEKENPGDFALFKRIRLSDLKRGIYTATPWGNARPSWHLQCAALALSHMPNVDIYCSSRDLLFPHDENQSAIVAAATGRPLTRFWLWCDTVRCPGQPRSDPSGGWTLADLDPPGGDAPRWPGRVVRHWLLGTHYRKPLICCPDRLTEAQQGLRRVDACLEALAALRDGRPCRELDQLLYDLRTGFVGAMDDDLNVSAAMASLFKVVRRINALLSARKLDPAGAGQILDRFRQIDRVLNVFTFPDRSADDRVAALIQARETARRRRDWDRADRLRDELQALGVTVRDGKLSNE